MPRSSVYHSLQRHLHRNCWTGPLLKRLQTLACRRVGGKSRWQRKSDRQRPRGKDPGGKALGGKAPGGTSRLKSGHVFERLRARLDGPIKSDGLPQVYPILVGFLRSKHSLVVNSKIWVKLGL
jgi:hypothetical protein